MTGVQTCALPICSDPLQRAKAIVKAVENWKDPKIIAEVSTGLGQPMDGIDVRQLDEKQLLSLRGW